MSSGRVNSPRAVSGLLMRNARIRARVAARSGGGMTSTPARVARVATRASAVRRCPCGNAACSGAPNRATGPAGGRCRVAVAARHRPSVSRGPTTAPPRRPARGRQPSRSGHRGRSTGRPGRRRGRGPWRSPAPRRPCRTSAARGRPAPRRRTPPAAGAPRRGPAVRGPPAAPSATSVAVSLPVPAPRSSTRAGRALERPAHCGRRVVGAVRGVGGRRAERRAVRRPCVLAHAISLSATRGRCGGTPRRRATVPTRRSPTPSWRPSTSRATTSTANGPPPAHRTTRLWWLFIHPGSPHRNLRCWQHCRAAGIPHGRHDCEAPRLTGRVRGKRTGEDHP